MLDARTRKRLFSAIVGEDVSAAGKAVTNSAEKVKQGL